MQQEFAKAIEAALAAQTPAESRDFNTRNEKLMHAALKWYCCPNPAHHEVPLGRRVADIYTSGQIIEIQTRSFFALRKKVPPLLEHAPVEVVLPLARRKLISWVDPATGEATPPRRSPKVGTFHQAFYELIHILPLLGLEGFTLRLLLLDIEEYRFLNGYGPQKKTRSTRMQTVPLALVDSLQLRCPADYLHLVPAELVDAGTTFTVRQFAQAAGISPKLAGRGIRVLCEAGAILPAGKQGRANLYLPLALGEEKGR